MRMDNILKISNVKIKPDLDVENLLSESPFAPSISGFSFTSGNKGMKGWISLHRQIQEHWLWKDKPFSKAQAWIDILLECNHKEQKVLIKNTLFVCGRGESLNSEITWAKRWGWGRSQVRCFFKLLVSDLMIELKPNNKTTKLTVLNYSTYQDKPTTDEQQLNIKRTSNEQQTNTNNNDNNENNVNNEREQESARSILIASFGSVKPMLIEFASELIGKFGVDKAKQILKTLAKKNFHSVDSMQKALNEDGSIKEKENAAYFKDHTDRGKGAIDFEKYDRLRKLQPAD
jgi:hypothetical protein